MQNEIQLLDKSQRRPFGDGLNWLNQSWCLLKDRFGKWLLVGTIFLLLNMAVGWILGLLATLSGIPFVFDLINTVCSTFMSAGLILTIASHAENGDFEIADVFSGFQLPVKKMILLAVILYLPILWANLFPMEQAPFAITLLWFLLSYVMWLMLPLAVLHELKPLSALKMSISGSLKNILPTFIFVFALCCVVLGFIFVSASVLALALTISANSFGLNYLYHDMLTSFTLFTSSPLNLVMIHLGILLIFMSVYFAYRNIWTNLPLK